MMQERVRGMRGATKYDKVVCREVCQVVNKGTQVFGQQVEIVNDYQPNYMMAIVHKVTQSFHSQFSIFSIISANTIHTWFLYRAPLTRTVLAYAIWTHPSVSSTLDNSRMTNTVLVCSPCCRTIRQCWCYTSARQCRRDLRKFSKPLCATHSKRHSTPTHNSGRPKRH